MELENVPSLSKHSIALLTLHASTCSAVEFWQEEGHLPRHDTFHIVESDSSAPAGGHGGPGPMLLWAPVLC